MSVNTSEFLCELFPLQSWRLCPVQIKDAFLVPTTKNAKLCKASEQPQTSLHAVGRTWYPCICLVPGGCEHPDQQVAQTVVQVLVHVNSPHRLKCEYFWGGWLGGHSELNQSVCGRCNLNCYWPQPTPSCSLPLLQGCFLQQLPLGNTTVVLSLGRAGGNSLTQIPACDSGVCTLVLGVELPNCHEVCKLKALVKHAEGEMQKSDTSTLSSCV